MVTGSAELATRVGYHEVHSFRSDLLGSYNEVSLVFTVLVIDHNHEFAFAEIGESLFNRI